MRRFAGHLFKLCSAVSGVLLVVVLAVWVRSHFRVDGLIYQPRIDNVRHLYQVWWGRGRLGVWVLAAEPTARSRLFWYSFAPKPVAAAPDPDEFGFLGVQLLSRTEYVSHRPPKTEVREIGISLPCWQAAVLSACLPAHWLLRRRRRKVGRLRLERRQCVRCGYDLRASPERCPECGTSTGKRPDNSAI